MRYLLRALFMAMVGALVLSTNALAQSGALGIYENGAENTGNAAAGAGADPTTASIAWYNSAGMMTLPEGHHISVGGQVMYSPLDFHVDDRTTQDGGSSDGQVLAPGFGAYGVFSVSRRVRLGFAANAPYGAIIKYQDGWAGRYHINSVAQMVMQLQPTAAFRLTDFMSVGVGVNVYMMSFHQNTSLPTLGNSGEDQYLDIKTLGFTGSGQVGLTFDPGDKAIIGIVYKAPVIFNSPGESTVSNAGPLAGAVVTEPLDTKIRMVFPMGVNLSMFFKVSPYFSILADFGWSQWSAFSDPQVEIAGEVEASLHRTWQDTARAAIGFHIQPIEAVRIRLGTSYDSAPVTDANRTPDAPVGAGIRVAAGLDVWASKVVRLNLGYSANIPDHTFGMNLDPTLPGTGRVSGTYSGALHTFAAGLYFKVPEKKQKKQK